MAQGPVTQRLRGRVQGCITGLAWAPHAAQLGIASAEGELILVDFQAGVDWPLRDANDADSRGFDAMGFSSCGNWLAAAGEGGVVSLWRLDGDLPQRMSVPPVGGWIDQLAWQPGGALLAVARGAEIWIWNRDDQAWLPPLRSPGSAVMALSWSPLGDQLAAGTGQGVCIWALPLASAQVAGPLQLETGSAVLQLVWGVDPPWLVAGLIDRRVVLWRICSDPCSASVTYWERFMPLIWRGYPAGSRDYWSLRRRPRSCGPAQKTTSSPGTPCCSPGIRIGSRHWLLAQLRCRS